MAFITTLHKPHDTLTHMPIALTMDDVSHLTTSTLDHVLCLCCHDLPQLSNSLRIHNTYANGFIPISVCT